MLANTNVTADVPDPAHEMGLRDPSLRKSDVGTPAILRSALVIVLAGMGLGGAIGTIALGLLAAGAAIGTTVVIPWWVQIIIPGPIAVGLAGSGAGGISGGTLGGLIGLVVGRNRRGYLMGRK